MVRAGAAVTGGWVWGGADTRVPHAVPSTVAPRILAIWQSSNPTPPAAACTRHVSPFFNGYVEHAR